MKENLKDILIVALLTVLSLSVFMAENRLAKCHQQIELLARQLRNREAYIISTKPHSSKTIIMDAHGITNYLVLSGLAKQETIVIGPGSAR